MQGFHYFIQPSLLSLIPPSYIIVPNRELANKSLLNSSTYAISSLNTNLPTMEPLNNIGIDIFKGQNSNNYDDMRDRKPSRSPNSSRDASMVSSMFSIPYHKKMERNNRMDINDSSNLSFELSYKTLQEKEI